MKKIISPCVIAILFFACNTKKDYEAFFKDPDIYSKSVFELNNVVMGNNFSPVVASRNYLYATVAAYEVIAAGYPSRFRSLAGQLHGLSVMPKAQNAKNINFEFAS